MRVFVVGATGAIGTRLVPQLIERGHEVVGTSRSPAKAESLRALGAEPVVLDILDPAAVRQAVVDIQPDAILHEATDLSNLRDLKHFDRSFAQTNRLRTEGTDNLLAAAHLAGVRRFVAQSFASYRYARVGGAVKTEEAPLDQDPVPAMRESEAAMEYLDRVVTDAGGIILRYGGFYGDPDDALVEAVRARKFPIVGDGNGITSFVHLEDAASATALAVEHDGPEIFNVVDDDPAPMRVWVPLVADVIGAKPPRRVPPWLARLVAGDAAVMMATEARGASNGKAKRVLGWTLRYPSWREGFVAAYGSSPLGRERIARATRRTHHSPT
jgi:2-alkyl-3-oxoalkanoate reductase